MKYLPLLIILLMACQPDEFPSIGAKNDREKQIVGTWQLVNATQIDESAKFKGFPESVTFKDITNIFPGHPYSDFALTLNDDGTYESSYGTSYFRLKSAKGKWSLDDVAAPSSLTLKGENGQQQTIEFKDFRGLNQNESGQKVLVVGLTRRLDNNKSFLSYEYKLRFKN